MCVCVCLNQTKEIQKLCTLWLYMLQKRFYVTSSFQGTGEFFDQTDPQEFRVRSAKGAVLLW